MGDLVTLPRRAPPLHIVETSPAGRHDFGDRDRIEITGGQRKTWAVRIDGWVYAEFNTATNALRCRCALARLEDLGALPSGPAHPEPSPEIA
jgi:hypothetical protein